MGNLNNSTVESLSTNIDDKTMHELYLWPFSDAVHAGVGSVMCSYQRINNSYACHNSKSQNGLLKTELGFEGFIVTDWRALHTGVAAIEGGLDMAMPNGSTYWGPGGQNNVKMIQNGSVEESRLTDSEHTLLKWSISQVLMTHFSGYQNYCFMVSNGTRCKFFMSDYCSILINSAG